MAVAILCQIITLLKGLSLDLSATLKSFARHDNAAAVTAPCPFSVWLLILMQSQYTSSKFCMCMNYEYRNVYNLCVMYLLLLLSSLY